MAIILEESATSDKFKPLILNEYRYNIQMGSRGCFGKKQKVETINGLKKISKIKIGEIVKSYNTETKEVEYKKVIDTFKYENKEKCIKMNYNGKIIVCTLDHKFFYQGEFVEIAKILESNGININ
jgi:hypothetical protein